jgi:hypothetical protein
MDYATINVDDPIGKTVGKRVVKNAWKLAMDGQKSLMQFRYNLGHGGLCPRGVFRFKSHQEADEWLIKMLVERALRSRT